MAVVIAEAIENTPDLLASPAAHKRHEFGITLRPPDSPAFLVNVGERPEQPARDLRQFPVLLAQLVENGIGVLREGTGHRAGSLIVPGQELAPAGIRCGHLSMVLTGRRRCGFGP